MLPLYTHIQTAMPCWFFHRIKCPQKHSGLSSYNVQNRKISTNSWDLSFEDLKNISIHWWPKYHASRTYRERTLFWAKVSLQKGWPRWNFPRCFICFHWMKGIMPEVLDGLRLSYIALTNSQAIFQEKTHSNKV